MKHLILLNILLAALSMPAHAATVQAIASDLKQSYGSFSGTAGSATSLSDSEISSILNGDPYSAIFGNSTAAAPGDYSVLDLGFGDKTAVTGSDVDLVIFSQWSGYSYSFGLEAYGKDGTRLSSYKYDVTDASVHAPCPDASCSQIVTTSINLFDNSATPTELADDIELGYIRLFIGGSTYNGATGGLNAYSNMTLAGAFNTTAVVPLPLPAILFGSGLGLLGWVGRRKKA